MKYSRLEPNPFPASVDPGARLEPGRPLALPLPWAEPLDLGQTLGCGQMFRWVRHDDTWYGPHARGALALRHTLVGLEARALGLEITAGEVWRFLGLDVSLNEVYRCLGDDPWMLRAIEAAPGLRILRQDPWQCLTGFICSQNSNVPKIELTLERIARRWGTVHRWPEGVETAAFPSPAVLAGVSESALRETGLGYRSPYLAAAARMAAEGEVEPDSLRTFAYDGALAALLRVPGIGRKVADCILLFALDQPQAMPVDVWVRRVLHEVYPRQIKRYLPDAAERAGGTLSTREYEALAAFARRRWGALAGYAQQYLFHARRTGRLAP